MKIVLISPIFADLGLCSISPQLRRENYQVDLLFIPELLQNYSRPLSRKMLDRIYEFINEAGIVGIKGLSENYHKTATLIDDIKKTIKALIVWGGEHPTIRPQDCIKHADVVCIGEGEEAMLELASKLERRENLDNIKNLLFRSNGGSVEKVQLRPPIDINSLLPLDYYLDSHYILESNKIRNLKEADFNGEFYSFSNRGCPFRCSFCCGTVMLDLYEGQEFCRQRSVENIMNELKEIKRCFSSCKAIWFNDGDFLAGKTQKDIGDFSERYRTEINLPFSIWTNPVSIRDEESIRMLKYAGLKAVDIGTITGSDRTQRQIYMRNTSPDLYRSRAKILNKHKIDTAYDVILANPYENDEDIISTIRLMMQLPKPYTIFTHILTYFPKTALYERALSDGIISEDQYIQSYTKSAYKVFEFKGSSVYLNIVLSLMRGRARRIDFFGLNLYRVPELVLKILIKKPVVNFFNNLPLKSFFYRGIAKFIMITYFVFDRSSKLIKSLFKLFKKI